MPISEPVILASIERYARERDRYIKLALRVADLCRADIIEQNAIRAQVTARAKTVKSFEGKLRRFARRNDKNFKTVDEVFDEIGDFAGVRIATYGPEDIDRVRDEIEALFVGPAGSAVDIDPKDKLNPAKGQFYRAVHCQVCLPQSELVGDYSNLKNTGCEVQICSMMAHVWNEIEHDIGYKPEGNGPGESERGLLETLGHLARAGDAAITQLLAANFKRMQEKSGKFADVHEFAAQMRNIFSDINVSVNAGIAYEALKLVEVESLDEFREHIGADHFLEKDIIERIDVFNTFLKNSNRPDLLLNPLSADFILFLTLDKSAGDLSKQLQSEHSKQVHERLFDLCRLYTEDQERE